MDSVRLGKALGTGTRQLAKTLVEVSHAISAEEGKPERAAAVAQTAPPTQRATPAATVISARRASKGFWRPLTHFTSVLWLEVTGTFFGVFAMLLGTAAWKHRAEWHSVSDTHVAAKLFAYVFFCALFAYFAVSSFVRANRKGAK